MLVPGVRFQDRKTHFGEESIKTKRFNKKIYRSFLHWQDDSYKLRSITLITKSIFKMTVAKHYSLLTDLVLV